MRQEESGVESSGRPVRAGGQIKVWVVMEKNEDNQSRQQDERLGNTSKHPGKLATCNSDRMLAGQKVELCSTPAYLQLLTGELEPSCIRSENQLAVSPRAPYPACLSGMVSSLDTSVGRFPASNLLVGVFYPSEMVKAFSDHPLLGHVSVFRLV